MIVQSDFLDHWKTRLLCDLLSDDASPLYVIRLWAHCQNRKTHIFKRTNSAMLKAICKAPHDAVAFETAMLEAGFIEIEEDEIIAHDWDEINSSLIASWVNGQKGGRPRKINPKGTHGIPVANPNETDKRREDREEKIGREIYFANQPSGDVAGQTDFLLSKRKRKLQGTKQEWFKQFWDAFNDKRGRAEAIDAWLDIDGLDESLAKVIIKAAEIEARNRPSLINIGRIAKMAQGWLSGRRWEDEIDPNPNAHQPERITF